MSFSRGAARQAIELGWSQDEIWAAHEAALDLAVTDVTAWAAVLQNRWLLYRGLWCLPDLELAMSPRLPAAAAQGLTVLYADGSGTTSKRTSGSGVAVYEPGRPPRYIAENEGFGSNNHAELLAIHRAIKAIPDVTRRIEIRTDSEYARGCAEEREWALKANVPVVLGLREDIDLRRRLGQKIEIVHVAGHKGITGNEAADIMANLGRTVAQDPEPLFFTEHKGPG